MRARSRSAWCATVAALLVLAGGAACRRDTMRSDSCKMHAGPLPISTFSAASTAIDRPRSAPSITVTPKRGLVATLCGA